MIRVQYTEEPHLKAVGHGAWIYRVRHVNTLVDQSIQLAMPWDMRILRLISVTVEPFLYTLV